MILWTQQLKQINDIFYTFKNGKTTHIPLEGKDLQRSQLFLSPSKYESYTMSNFKIIVIYCMYYDFASSKIELLKKLNSYSKQDFAKAGQLRSDVLAYNYIIKKDQDTLETITISPYEAYQRKLIHPFGLAEYYDHHPTEIIGRIMKKEIQKAQVLKDFFKFKTSE